MKCGNAKQKFRSNISKTCCKGQTFHFHEEHHEVYQSIISGPMFQQEPSRLNAKNDNANSTSRHDSSVMCGSMHFQFLRPRCRFIRFALALRLQEAMNATEPEKMDVLKKHQTLCQISFRSLMFEVSLSSLSNMVSVVSFPFGFSVGDGREHGQLTPKMQEIPFDFVPAVSGVMVVRSQDMS